VTALVSDALCVLTNQNRTTRWSFGWQTIRL